MATKTVNYTSLTNSRTPTTGYMTIGYSSSGTNQDADVTFPAIGITGVITEVRLYYAWDNSAAGEGFQASTTHKAGSNTYSISGSSGSGSVVLTSGYSNTATWSINICGAVATNSTSKGYYKSSTDLYVVVTYTPYTACGAPTACSVSSTISEGSVTLSWSGASAGTNNTITGYEVQYSDSADNASWGAWTALTTVSTTATSGSLTVSPPGTRGNYRRYQVRTQGSAGSSYYSGWKVSTNSLRKDTQPTAPTTFTASPTTYVLENITLSWSGTVAGTSAIASYTIEQATSTDNATWGTWASVTTVSSSSPSGSTTVTPTRVAGTYTKYRISVTDALGVDSSGYKESNSVYASITACTAPTSCSVSGTLSEGSVTLSWSGAASGAGNTITGYEIQYSESADNSAWGSWSALTTVSTTATSGSCSVSPSATRGNYRRFQVRTQGSAGSSYYSTWKVSTNSVRRDTQPTAPSTFTASPAAYVSENIMLAWSGAAAGTSAIASYTLEQATSANGTSWSAWSSLTTINSSATSGSTTVSPTRVVGTYTKYRISVTDTLGVTSAAYKESNSIYATYTDCSAPTTCSVSAAVSEGDVTLSWSGAAGGAGNTITGYEVQYSESSDNATWGSWAVLTTVSSTASSGSCTVSPPATRGSYRRFQVRTQGSAGSAYYSDWKVSTNSLRKNTLPTAPTSVTASPSVYDAPQATLTWSGAVAGTSAISYYVIQSCTSTDGVTWTNWSSLTTSTGGSAALAPSNVPGTYTKYRVSVVDMLSAVSGYAYSNAIKKNSPPPIPSVLAPKAGSMTFNATPRILVKTGVEPDGQSQKVCVRIGYGDWETSVDNPELFSVNGYLPDNAATIFCPDALSAGSYLLSVKAMDKDLDSESGIVSRSFTVAVPAYAATPITAGATVVKASHITELRDAVDTVRNYYGLSAYPWQEQLVSGKTLIKNWTNHVLELRKAVDQIVGIINSFDSAYGMDVPAVIWISLQPGRPKAEVMQQLRDILLIL